MKPLCKIGGKVTRAHLGTIGLKFVKVKITFAEIFENWTFREQRFCQMKKPNNKKVTRVNTFIGRINLKNSSQAKVSTALFQTIRSPDYVYMYLGSRLHSWVGISCTCNWNKYHSNHCRSIWDSFCAYQSMATFDVVYLWKGEQNVVTGDSKL